MLLQSLPYLVYEAQSLAYIITNAIIAGFAFSAYFKRPRLGFLLVAITCAFSGLERCATWILRHYLPEANRLIYVGIELADIVSVAISTIGILLIIIELLAALPPPVPAERQK